MLECCSLSLLYLYLLLLCFNYVGESLTEVDSEEPGTKYFQSFELSVNDQFGCGFGDRICSKFFFQLRGFQHACGQTAHKSF